MNKQLTFLDLFAGIGGFRLGMEMAGHKCVGHCEIDKFADKSYRAMHDVKEDEWLGTDIRAVRASDLPRADVWCFGFPCQDISIAGKTLGFAGQRSSLFFTVMRLIEDIEEKDRPSILLIENVKNLLSVNRGLDFARLLVEMDGGGYDAEWDVLNSKDFGVPQNRERVFIVGHLRGRGGRKVFPVTGGNGEVDNGDLDSKLRLCKLDKVNKDGSFASILDAGIKDVGCQTAGTITARYHKGIGGNNDNMALVGEPQLKQVGQIYGTDREPNPQAGRIFSTDGISPCLDTCEGGNRMPKICIDKSYNDTKIIDAANCITAREDRGVSNRKAEGTAVIVGNTNPSGNGMNGNVYDSEGLAPTLTTNKGEGNKQDRHGVLMTQREVKKTDVTGVSAIASGIYTNVSKDFQSGPLNDTSRCLKANKHDAGVVIRQRPGGKNNGGLKDIAPTITKNSYEQNNHLIQNCKIRKLTPKECFRLQGFTDEYFDRAKWHSQEESEEILRKYPKHKGKRQFTHEERIERMSDSQLYKQAGNSVTVNVIYEIAKRLKYENMQR